MFVDGEVIVNVESVGICGFDMYVFLGYDECCLVFLILGYEVVGIMMKWGMYEICVMVNLFVFCGKCCVCKVGQDNFCFNCQIILMLLCEGGFVEQIIILIGNLVDVFDYVSVD